MPASTFYALLWHLALQDRFFKGVIGKYVAELNRGWVKSISVYNFWVP